LKAGARFMGAGDSTPLAVKKVEKKEKEKNMFGFKTHYL
jgi:hypothetical protein